MNDYKTKSGNYNSGKSKPYGNRNNQMPDMSQMDLPEDYVQEAENILTSYKEKHGLKISTSKLRNILTLVSDIYNEEYIRTDEYLLQNSMEKIQVLRIRTLYEAGRDKDVNDFIVESRLINYIKGIQNSRKKFIIFARYMEALVAYHRFLGGN